MFSPSGELKVRGDREGPIRGSEIGVGVEGIFISALRVMFVISFVVFGELAISGDV